MTDPTPKRLTQNISLYPEHLDAINWLATRWRWNRSRVLRDLIEREMHALAFGHGYTDWREMIRAEPEK